MIQSIVNSLPLLLHISKLEKINKIVVRWARILEILLGLKGLNLRKPKVTLEII